MSKISSFEGMPATLTAWERGLPPSRPVTGVLGTLLLGRGTDTVPEHRAGWSNLCPPGSEAPRVPSAPRCPQGSEVCLPTASTGRASPQTVWAAKGKLEAHPDPGVAWPGPARPQHPARPTAPGLAHSAQRGPRTCCTCRSSLRPAAPASRTAPAPC